MTQSRKYGAFREESYSLCSRNSSGRLAFGPLHHTGDASIHLVVLVVVVVIVVVVVMASFFYFIFLNIFIYQTL